MIATDLPARLREIREAAGLARKDLCALTGLSQATISRLEADDRTPSLDALTKIAAACGRDVEISFPISGTGTAGEVVGEAESRERVTEKRLSRATALLSSASNAELVLAERLIAALVLR